MNFPVRKVSDPLQSTFCDGEQETAPMTENRMPLRLMRDWVVIGRWRDDSSIKQATGGDRETGSR